MYMNGIGVKANTFQATALFRKACHSGEPLGCNNLAVAYRFGRGVKQDSAEALKYYGKACDLKDQNGCDNYAELKRGKQ